VKMALPSTMPSTPLLLSMLLERGPSLQPDNLVVEKISSGYSTITLAEHSRRSKALAISLAKVGVQRGDRVATFCYNTNRHLACYHAIPLMGSVCHPLNIRLGPKELTWILGHAEDCVLIVDAVLMEVFSKVPKDGLKLLKAIVVCGEDDKSGGWQSSPAAAALRNMVPLVVDYDEFLQPNLAEVAGFEWPQDIPEHSAAGMCYTSGTTGNPKGVLYSHRSTFIHTLAMPGKDQHNLGGADVLLPVVPYFHANGWGLPYLNLMLGSRMLHNGRYTDPATILQMAVDWEATYSAAVPAIWQTARQTLEADPQKYKGKIKISSICCGGSAPPPEMMSWYKQEHGVIFAQGWGMTETSPMGTNGKPVTKHEHLSWTDAEQFRYVAVAGIPAAGIEMKIVDPEDFTKRLPNDGQAQGELLVRGPWVTASYYKIDKPEAFIDGWLVTGDVASIDAGGNMIIRDRSKDVIKSGGEWISSIDLEKHIMGMPNAFSSVAVVAQPHPKWDERPVVVGVLGPNTDPSSVTTEKIRAFCKDSFAKYELPDEVLVWKELPMTGTGKVDKKRIRAMLGEQKYQLPDLRNAQAKL